MGRRKKRRDARRRARIAALNEAANRLVHVPPTMAPTLAEMNAVGHGSQQDHGSSMAEESLVPWGDLSMGPVIAHLQALTNAAMCSEA